jgi:hypothetical protein
MLQTLYLSLHRHSWGWKTLEEEELRLTLVLLSGYHLESSIGIRRLEEKLSLFDEKFRRQDCRIIRDWIASKIDPKVISPSRQGPRKSKNVCKARKKLQNANQGAALVKKFRKTLPKKSTIWEKCLERDKKATKPQTSRCFSLKNPLNPPEKIDNLRKCFRKRRVVGKNCRKSGTKCAIAWHKETFRLMCHRTAQNVPQHGTKSLYVPREDTKCAIARHKKTFRL